MPGNDIKNKAPTHTAYTFRRVGRKSGCWEECGTARLDRNTGEMSIAVKMVPIGGFTGFVRCFPIGTTPPFEPVRPGDDNDDGDEDLAD
jgi:hypothetical protein